MSALRTKYKNEYADKLLAYFRSYPREDDMARGGKGAKLSLPGMCEFCRKNGIYLTDIERWRGENERFLAAYEEAMRYLRMLILEGVISGDISPAAAKYYLEEAEDENEHESVGGFVINVCYEEGVA